ncbi:MAG: chlorophyll synthesis pathway protein BchC [Acetobacteraceae bacterium]
MDGVAVVLSEPESLVLRSLELTPPGPADVVAEIVWSGISTGTERLLYSGRMPDFPGMGYPLVPGYESVGWVTAAGPASGREAGEFAFVPGARCFGPVRGLFGGAAARVVVPGTRVLPIPASLGEDGVLLALAATAHHAARAGRAAPELIVGHGVLGRLLARVLLATGHEAPVVWERDRSRAAGARGYRVLAPEEDDRRDYRCICDVSGDCGLLDALIARLAPGGEIVLGGFYPERLGFSFPPAFLREARLSVAAQWQPADLAAVAALVREAKLLLDGLITHRSAARSAAQAYRTAFDDPACLKMVLDWRNCS